MNEPVPVQYMEFTNNGGSLCVSRRRVYGPAADQILAEETITTPGQAGTVRYGLGDDKGTICDVLQLNSPGNWTVGGSNIVIPSYNTLNNNCATYGQESWYKYSGQWLPAGPFVTPHTLNRAIYDSKQTDPYWYQKWLLMVPTR